MTSLLSTVLTLVMALLAMAFYTLFERKLLAHSQLRQGPNKVGLIGLPQPLADALKLLAKQQALPSRANQLGFVLAPCVALGLALTLWTHYPYVYPAYHLPFACLSFLVISSLNVYPVLAAGWTSNSKYALLGTMRGIAQTISYEIVFALLLISLLVLMQSFNFVTPLHYRWTWSILLMPPLGVVWFVTLLAETNRTPFDFTEGESELVSGFNVEYGGGGFTLLFMAEYVSILGASMLTSALFFSSWLPLFLAPLFLLGGGVGVSALFVTVRATLPRMRYDQLMMLTWKSFLPFGLFWLLFVVPVVGVISA